jgi:outer membrane lipoprotein-sorting protein
VTIPSPLRLIAAILLWVAFPVHSFDLTAFTASMAQNSYRDLRALLVIEIKLPGAQTTCRATFAQAGPSSYALEVLEPTEEQKLIRCNESGCKIRLGTSGTAQNYIHNLGGINGINNEVQVISMLQASQAKVTAGEPGITIVFCPGAAGTEYAAFDFKIAFNTTINKIVSLAYKQKNRNNFLAQITFTYQNLGGIYVPEQTTFLDAGTGMEITTKYYQVIVNQGIPSETFKFP